MKKLIFCAIGIASTLAGCATLESPLRGLNSNLTVFTSAKGSQYFVLDQDPIVLTKQLLEQAQELDREQRPIGVPITWSLSKNSEWKFAEKDGVEFLPPPNLDVPGIGEIEKALSGFVNFNDIRNLSNPRGLVSGCQAVGTDGLTYKCLIKVKPEQEVRFKYKIHLVNSKGESKIIDPNMMN
jgi:hypothetical protein